MSITVSASGKAYARIALALVMAAMGLYVARSEPPGGAVVGFLLLFGAVLMAMRTARRRLPTWARRTTAAVGALVAALAAFIIHSRTIEAPLFAQGPGVPSVGSSASSPQPSAAIERARSVVRDAMVEQNLPGVSVAVARSGSGHSGSGHSGSGNSGSGNTGSGNSGSGNTVWAEGFGWRDIVTRTPVTPATRFNIGTAAQVVTPAAAASLGLTNTGTDPAAAWSPEHVGEPEEDFPGFTAVHDLILRPLGIVPPRQPLPGERATFYVPATFWKDDTTDPRRGRRLMYMRDLACCAGTMAFYSTPSDLVRFAAATNAPSVNGELAGGTVLSLTRSAGSGVVVAVASNIAHANTAAIARRVAEVFADGR